jgi:hypothetical protein
MYCKECGAEIEENTQFCPKCGVDVNVTLQTSDNNYKKERPIFTTFWLIFLLIVRIIFGVLFLFSIQILVKDSYISNGVIIIYLAGAILGVATNILLLLWKKIGFWIFISNSIAFSILDSIVIGASLGRTLSGLLGILIMWSVLQIRKNGKTTWEQLI